MNTTLRGGETVLMTAPVPKEVADQFREIAKANGTPLRVLGGMLYEQFVTDHAAGKVQVAPIQIVATDPTPTAAHVVDRAR